MLRQLATALLVLPLLAQGATTPKDAILLSTVKSLTLHANRLTSSRRSPPIPQLTCVGGNACRFYEVPTLRCTNAGSSYGSEDVEWTCKGDLPPEFKLGSTEVVCEGYASPDDDRVLKGSCGVEYRLVLTDAGEEKYGIDDGGGEWGLPGGKGQQIAGWGFNVLFWAVFLGVGAIVLSRIALGIYNYFYPNRRQPWHRGQFPNFGGGGGYDHRPDDDDPPPPYSRYSQPRRSTPKSSKPPQSRAPGTSGQWQPGWAGAAAAGAAGYAAGNWMGNRGGESSRTAAQRGQQQAGRRGGMGSWFGEGGGSSAPGRSGGGSMMGSSAEPSANRYESTGFGGTRRR